MWLVRIVARVMLCLDALNAWLGRRLPWVLVGVGGLHSHWVGTGIGVGWHVVILHLMSFTSPRNLKRPQEAKKPKRSEEREQIRTCSLSYTHDSAQRSEASQMARKVRDRRKSTSGPVPARQ